MFTNKSESAHGLWFKF